VRSRRYRLIRATRLIPTQDSIYGTSRYSSGYPYGYSGYYMDSWAFPYVFWPVPIHNHYYCESTCVCGTPLTSFE
jgi:hypothetical protein